MVERRQHLRFTLEAGQPVRVCGEGVGQHLECNVPVEGCVPGLIDLSHPAFADQGGDVVVAEPGADLKGP